MYQMGADSIKWGSEDHWTFTPHKVEKIRTALAASMPAPPPPRWRRAGGGRGGGGGGGGRGGGRGGPDGDALWKALRQPQHRDPRGFIMPADHPDFGTTVRFVNTLIKSGIAVHRATAPFTVAGKQYPAGSLIVKTAQAFRPHVMDMFEPQDHPDDIPYPGAPPIAPYDVAGYTLAYQMGVKFDRILDAFDGPFEKLTDFAKVPAGTDRRGAEGGGLLLQPRVERQLHRHQPAACRQRRRLVAGDRTARRRHVLRRREAEHARDPRQGRGRSRRQLPGSGNGAHRIDVAAAQAAHRIVRHLWRRHAFRLDAAAVRELRVPVRGRLSADARRRQPAREIRRAGVQRIGSERRRWWWTRRRRWRRRCGGSRCNASG